MTDDTKEVREELAQLEQKFVRLTEDFTQLRHEVNELERKLERRT